MEEQNKKTKMLKLPLEKELIINQFNRQVEHCSPEQLVILVKDIHASYVVERFMFQEMLKDSWGFSYIEVQDMGQMPVDELLENDNDTPETSNNSDNDSSVDNNSLSLFARLRRFSIMILIAIKVLLE